MRSPFQCRSVPALRRFRVSSREERRAEVERVGHRPASLPQCLRVVEGKTRPGKTFIRDTAEILVDPAHPAFERKPEVVALEELPISHPEGAAQLEVGLAIVMHWRGLRATISPSRCRVGVAAGETAAERGPPVQHRLVGITRQVDRGDARELQWHGLRQAAHADARLPGVRRLQLAIQVGAAREPDAYRRVGFHADDDAAQLVAVVEHQPEKSLATLCPRRLQVHRGSKSR